MGQTGPGKHNSKYDMMCSVNMRKVLWLDRVENKKRKKKYSEGLRKPRRNADWCPKIGVLKLVS